ncbi:MAG: radical SAM protein [Caldiserica bacterium]|nr:radical SAM protein [Caldisericota bacterium]
MHERTEYIDLFDDAVRALFSDAVRITLRDPSVAAFFVRMRRAQLTAERRRTQLAEEGVHVPPFMILSVTSRCNLACAGCYAEAQERREESDMTPAELLSVVRQGNDLGVGIMLLGGGEPMTRAGDLLLIAHNIPDVMFPVLTNVRSWTNIS